MLTTCWKARRAGHREPDVTELVERDDGFMYTLRPARYFAPPGAWREFERTALDLARGTVLDVGCGAGRFALALQDRGVAVTGLDVSAGAVAVAAQRGVRDVVHGTVASLAAGARRYDTFLLMGENLGLLEGARRAAGFLGELAAIARPGARIVGHGVDPHAAATVDQVLAAYLRRDRERERAREDERRPEDERAREGERRPEGERGRLAGEMTIRIRHRDLATGWFGYLLCSPAELGDLARPAGWELASADYADKANYLAVLTLTPQPR
jgi:SAM-dependent methyltransferase